MNGQLTAWLNKVAMFTKRGMPECTAEFTATLATGTLKELVPDEQQMLGLPTEVALSCRRMIADEQVTQMAVKTADARGLQISENATVKLALKRTVLLERMRVKKEEGKNDTAQARISFVVKIDGREEWPTRELVGRRLQLSLRAAPGPVPGS